MTKSLIFFDTETTGLDHQLDQIIELAFIKVPSLDFFEIKEEDIFHRYVKPTVRISQNSLKIHGISENFLQDKPSFGEICDELLLFIGDSILIAHNSTFDMNFLNASLSREGKLKLTNKVVDSLLVARKRFKGQSVGLDRLPKLLGIPFQRGFHSALEDSLILARVYAAMMKPVQESLFIEREENEPSLEFAMSSRLID